MLYSFLFRKNILVVISKDKLITSDTVAPIIREYKEGVGGKVYFYVPYIHTLEFINKNFILYKAISEVSDIKIVATGEGVRRKFSYIKTLFFWIVLSIKGAKFIHFGMLNVWPFKVLTWINANNIFYMQNDTYHHTNAEVQAKANLIGNVDEILHQKWKDSKETSGNNIIANSKEHYFLKNPKNSHKNVFVFSGSRLMPSWINFINDNLHLYKEYYKDVDFSNGSIVYVLGTFEPVADLRNHNSTELLFIETIKILDNLDLDLPILIKPHAYTQMDVVHRVLDNTNSNNFYISYFHPTLLSLKAKVWICNLYSTTCADAYCMGVKTIEYTDYSDKYLEASLGKSVGHQYIDYFIQNNDYNLRLAIIENTVSSNESSAFRCKPLDHNNLFGALS
jgi:hypothetical protein